MVEMNRIKELSLKIGHQFKAEKVNFFIKEIVTKGKVLYEARH